MRTIILFATLALFSLTAHAQTGIGTTSPHPSSQLQIHATDKGVLIPQVKITDLENDSIIAGSETAQSLLVFNPEKTGAIEIGYYYWLNGKWQYLAADSNTYANVHYDGDTFYYRKEDGTTEVITIETLIQTNQKTYEVVGDDAYVVVTPEILDPTDAPNHTTFKVEVKAATPEFFYMPTVLFDTSVLETKTLDLYAIYVAQFGTPKAKNAAAPDAIPYLPNATDLHYYITDFDETVIKADNLNITDEGVVSYEVIGNANAYSFMTVIFVVKK